MSRSIWKPQYIANDFFLQYNFEEKKQSTDFILYNRATKIHKKMIGLTLQVYNGIRFFSLFISRDMVGHSVGEFAPTRKKPIQKKKKIKKK